MPIAHDNNAVAACQDSCGGKKQNMTDCDLGHHPGKVHESHPVLKDATDRPKVDLMPEQMQGQEQGQEIFSVTPTRVVYDEKIMVSTTQPCEAEGTVLASNVKES